VRGALERHWLTLGVGVLAATPVILSTARGVTEGWTAVGDDAVIALRSFDVFSSHPPLVGQYSSSSAVAGTPAYGTGPLLYWLLALPVRTPWAAAPTVAIGVVNTACVMATVALARLRGGATLMLMTAAALVVMSGSLVAVVWSDTWNPAAGLLPLLVLVFVAWSVACGHHRLLPLAALLASFAVQCHLSYVPPVAGALAVAVAGLVAMRRDLDRRALRRSVIATAVVTVVCWSAPLLQQLTGDPGNLGTIARAAVSGDPTLGPQLGWDAIVHTVGVPPWWLEIADRPTVRIEEVGEPLGGARQLSAVLILAALVALGVAARRRGRRDVAIGAALALVFVVAVGAVTSATPTTGILALSIGYSIWWASVAGMFAWVVLAWGALTLVRPAPLPRRALAGIAVAGAIAGAVTLMRAGRGEDATRAVYAPVSTIGDRLERAVPRERTLLVERGPSPTGFDLIFDVHMGVAYQLRRQRKGVAVRDPRTLGKSYALRPDRQIDGVVWIGFSGESPPRPGQLVARVQLAQRPGEPASSAVAWLLPPR
jgi:hypothetical protein